jgi:hypothetical protein
VSTRGHRRLFGDMRFIGELHQPTVGLLGCSQPWELLPEVSRVPARS